MTVPPLPWVFINGESFDAVKANEKALLLELMHFADELVDPDSLDLPVKTEAGKAEMEMAKALITRMTDKWQPTKYKDDYRTSLLGLIEKKVESGDQELKAPKGKPKRPTNVIDLVEVLKQSMAEAAKPANRSSQPTRVAKAKRKKAA